jgi:hypothetical protein|tara:strand:- start:971 stop:1351 length:381 start_codon:yes stop_codon:yes gene_type:complete
MKNYLFLLLFTIIQYTWDRLTSYCHTNTGEILLFVHHLISAYIYVGGFLFNPLYHLIFVSIVLIHWVTNNNKCFVTQITNEYCGYKEDKKFKDVIQIFKIYKIHKDIHWYLLIGIIVYDIIKIYYK